MATNCNNQGPLNIAENMRDVINNVIFFTTPTTDPLNVPFEPITKPHANFTGRDQYINSAIEYLSQPVAADVQIQFPCLVIHALGGYGKTETARRIASVCSKEGRFHHYIWIDSEDDISIRICFVTVMKYIGLALPHETAESSNFDSLLHRFHNLLVGRRNEKFLIICDNVEDYDEVLKFLPLNYHAPNIAVLMTSRSPFTRTSYGNVRNQQLGLMEEAEAMQLVDTILGRQSMDSEKDKELLVERSGRITLVLCVMTSTIKSERKYKSDYGIEDYLKKIRYEPATYGDESKALDLNYDKSLQRIVRFAVDKLDSVGGPIGKIAVKVFDRLAYCSSTNYIRPIFFKHYFRDICQEAYNVTMKLPMEPADDLQIMRIVLEKLSEFSLAQIDGKAFDVHRWIQASRRLDLKESGNDRNTLKKLLFLTAETYYYRHNLPIIWQHVADYYPDLVNEYYAEKRTIRKIPSKNIELLERIIHVLMLNEDFKQSEDFSEKVFNFIVQEFFTKSRCNNDLERAVNAFDYDVSQKSADLISVAIDRARVDVLKWLVEEKSCIPQKFHLFKCFRFFEESVKKLQQLNIDLDEIIEKNPGRNLLECLFTCALNKLESLNMSWASRCIESYEIESIVSALEYLVPSDSNSQIGYGIRSKLPGLIEILKVGFGKIIERNRGKSLLECLFHYASENVQGSGIEIEIYNIIGVMLCALEKLKLLNFDSGEMVDQNPGNNLLECLLRSELKKGKLFKTTNSIALFEIIGVILCALKKLKPSIELNEIMEKYSEKNLLQYYFIRSRSHEHENEMQYDVDMNPLHEAACDNNSTERDSINVKRQRSCLSDIRPT